jgi:adenine-specific DNA-methyltransferase
MPGPPTRASTPPVERRRNTAKSFSPEPAQTSPNPPTPSTSSSPATGKMPQLIITTGMQLIASSQFNRFGWNFDLQYTCEALNNSSAMSICEFLNGDSAEILNQFPVEKFKLIMTSPPYNVGKEYESKQSIESYLTQQKEVIKLLVSRLHPNGSICWQVGNFIHKGEVFPLDFFYYDIFKELGLKLRNRIIWRFGHGLHTSRRFSGRYEVILWFTKTDDYTFNLDDVREEAKYPGKRHFKGPKKGQLSGNPKGKNPSDIWDVPPDYLNFLEDEWNREVWDVPNVKANHVEKTEHPCQYPISLVSRCVLALTNRDDWVLDPYAGVGSTLLGSLGNNRNAVGIEKVAKYHKIGLARIKSFEQGRLPIRPLEKPIYDHKQSTLSVMPPEFKV